jgi:hypothetical protein
MYAAPGTAAAGSKPATTSRAFDLQMDGLDCDEEPAATRHAPENSTASSNDPGSGRRTRRLTTYGEQSEGIRSGPATVLGVPRSGGQGGLDPERPTSTCCRVRHRRGLPVVSAR